MANDLLTGIWSLPRPRIDSLSARLLSGRASRQPFISDASGANLTSDYTAGGRYSSQRDIMRGDMRTVIPPTGAWANIAPTPQAGQPMATATTGPERFNQFSYVRPPSFQINTQPISAAAGKFQINTQPIWGGQSPATGYRPPQVAYAQIASRIAWGTPPQKEPPEE